MKQIILLLAAFLTCTAAIVAQEVTYVIFNRDCMSQLEYRYSYPNVKGENAVWAYSIKPNILEHYIFMTEGAGVYSPEMPAGAITCRNLDLDDAFVASINRGAQQMLIVFQRQSGGYWLMPVQSATLIARSGSKYWVRARQSSFQFDSLRLVNEQNLAVAGSPTAAYFSGVKLNSCLTAFSFHCEPPKNGQMRSDIQFIPSIGFTNDRTGNSASEAMENEIQLVKVNGKALDDHIAAACPEGTGKIAVSKYQRPAKYGDESFEPDKELSSIMQKEQDEDSPATYSNGPNGIRCAENWEPGTHIVQKGENLRAIGRTYYVTEANLIKWNKIQNPDKIEICQKIWLKQPPANAKSTNKGVKAQVYDTEAAEIESGKKVKMQGLRQAQAPVSKGKATVEKSSIAERPLVYDQLPADENDYEYFEAEKPAYKGGSRVHTVHRGEYIYKIAKDYACPEECIRIANDMPLEGNVPLSIGQKLIIPECTCTVNGKLIQKPAAAQTSAKPPVRKPAATNKQPFESRVKPRASILDDPETPTVYDAGADQYPEPERAKNDNRFEENPLYDDRESTAGANKSNAKKRPATDKQPKEQQFKEHIPKQGETLRSIATKYRVDASELAQINGIGINETPTPGKTMLIPIEDDER